MSNDKELRELMKQVVQSNDPELMKMITQLLQNQNETGSSGNDEPTTEDIKNVETQFPEFTMNKNKEDKVGGVPVNKGKRFNSFKDDGLEHKDDANKTPETQGVERRRKPFKKVQQNCTRCNNSVEVHPQHARDFFVCDKCLRR